MKQEIASDQRRRGDMAMIHIAAKRLFGDVSTDGEGRLEYENWLEGKTGKRSAANLSKTARIELIKGLRRDGLIPDRNPGGKGVDRPTKAQWAMIAGLARNIEWDGLDDPALRGFVQRTAKVDAPRFMTRTQASKVILGLQEWLKGKGAQDEMP